MNGAIDLMPRSCREVLGRRAWARRWGLTYALVGALCAGSWWATSASAARLDQERTRLAAAVRLEWERSEAVQRLLGEIRSAEAAITRHNRLAWPVRVSTAVGVLAEAMPEGVSLTSLSVSPREERVGGKPAAGAAAGTKTVESVRPLMVLEVEGIAPGDGEVAGLVSRMERSGLFSRVALDYSRSVTVRGRDARRFRATSEVDLTRRYVLVPGGEGAGSAVAGVVEEQIERGGAGVSE